MNIYLFLLFKTCHATPGKSYMVVYVCLLQLHKTFINTLKTFHFPDDIFTCIFMTKVFCYNFISFSSQGPNDNMSSLVQLMSWCRKGDKPLSLIMWHSVYAHSMLPYGVWGRRWTTCLLYDSPLLGLCFKWQFVHKFGVVVRNFRMISCLCYQRFA